MNLKEAYLEYRQDSPKYPSIRKLVDKFDEYQVEIGKDIESMTARDLAHFFPWAGWTAQVTFYDKRSELTNYYKFLQANGVNCDPATPKLVRFNQINCSDRYDKLFGSFEEMEDDFNVVFFSGDYDAEREGVAILLSAIGLDKEEAAALCVRDVDMAEQSITSKQRKYEQVEPFILQRLQSGSHTNPSDYVINPSQVRTLNKPRMESFTRRLISKAMRRWEKSKFAGKSISPRYLWYSYLFLKLWEYEKETGRLIAADEDVMDCIERWTGKRRTSPSSEYLLVRDYVSWKKTYKKW